MSASNDEKKEEVLASVPSSADQADLKAAVEDATKAEDTETPKPAAAAPSNNKASPSKDNKNVLSYFLSNFVLPDAHKSKLYIERLHASNTILGSYGANDSNLAFVGYGLLFVSEILKYSASALAATAPGAPGAAAAASSPVLRALLDRLASNATSLVAPSRALSDLISDIRIFNRLWGLVPLSVWALETYAQPPSDPVLRGIAYTQVVANLAYQPLENVAYLAMHRVLPQSVVSDKLQGALWIYSCYLWALHVVLDLVRLRREAQLQQEGKMAKDDFSWYQYLVINLAYLPLTVHWSLPQGLLNDVTVGFLGCTAAAASIYPRWKGVFK